MGYGDIAFLVILVDIINKTGIIKNNSVKSFSISFFITFFTLLTSQIQ